MGYTVIRYVTASGVDVVAKYLREMRDRVGLLAITRRLARLELGQFGDSSPCRDDIWELRIHLSAGYRIYYAIVANQVVLLLAAGSKRTQQGDIRRAIRNLADYEARK
jgi:putative addiction module killer protein